MPPRKQVVPQTFEKVQWVAVATDVRNYQFCLLSDFIECHTFEEVRWAYGKLLYTDVPKQESLSDLSNAQAFKKGKGKWWLYHQSLRNNWDYSELECLIIQRNILKVKDKIAMAGEMLRLAKIVL